MDIDSTGEFRTSSSRFVHPRGHKLLPVAKVAITDLSGVCYDLVNGSDFC